MKNWLGELDSLLGELDKNVRGVARAVRSALDDGPFQIITYRSYGNGRLAYIHGRAQENRGTGPSGDTDSTLRNLLTPIVAPIATRFPTRSSWSSTNTRTAP